MESGLGGEGNIEARGGRGFKKGILMGESGGVFRRGRGDGKFMGEGIGGICWREGETGDEG